MKAAISIVEAATSKAAKSHVEVDDTDGALSFQLRSREGFLVVGELSVEGDLNANALQWARNAEWTQRQDPPSPDNVIAITRAFAKYLQQMDERLEDPLSADPPGREQIMTARRALLKVGLPPKRKRKTA